MPSTRAEDTVGAAARGLLAGATPVAERDLVLLACKEVSLRRGMRVHPLGFFYTLLKGEADGHLADIRLHIWSHASLALRDDLGTIHDHSWELVSWVIVGSLTNRTFEARKTTSGTFEGSTVLYGERNRLRREGRFDVDEAGEERLRSGDTYRLLPGVLHATVDVSIPTVTMVVATRANNETRIMTPVDQRSLGLDAAERPLARREDIRAAFDVAIATASRP